MDTDLFKRFAPVIRDLTQSELAGSASLYNKLTLAQQGALRICYAPFEYINPQAKVVIVGITPGKTQMLNAIREARRQLDLGNDEMQVLRAAKATGAFSGAMGPNLAAMLDHIGLHRWLGITGCEQLFWGGAASHLAQAASALRNPVFVDGENYSGTPKVGRNPFLRESLLAYFGEDVAPLRNAVFIPLGPTVSEAISLLVARGLLDGARVLDGMPHPSGANAERIAYFLGRKSRQSLSNKTNPDTLDQAKARLTQQVMSFA
jgi:hypothetical protein